MPEKPTYEQLEQRVLELEDADFKRRQVEEALQRSEMLLKETQRISKTGGWEYDVQTKAATFTDTIFDIYGVTFSDPSKGIKFYHKDDRNIVEHSFENAIARNEPYDIEVRFINARGENLWVRTVGKPVTENGKVVKVIGNLMDITDRKQTEEALLESEERLNEAQKLARVGHYVFDIKTDCWTSSPELDVIFGIDDSHKKDFACWVQLVHPDHSKMMSTYFQENILNKHQSFNKEYKIINIKTGQVKWVHGLGELKFDENNNPVEMFGTIQDITERIQIKQEREKLIKKLQEALEDVKTLSGLLPICAKCKKIRDDKGYWNSLEVFFEKHSDVSFSHSMCSECCDELYGKEGWYIRMKQKKKESE